MGVGEWSTDLQIVKRREKIQAASSGKEMLRELGHVRPTKFTREFLLTL